MNGMGKKEWLLCAHKITRKVSNQTNERTERTNGQNFKAKTNRHALTFRLLLFKTKSSLFYHIPVNEVYGCGINRRKRIHSLLLYMAVNICNVIHIPFRFVSFRFTCVYENHELSNSSSSSSDGRRRYQERKKENARERCSKTLPNGSVCRQMRIFCPVSMYSTMFTHCVDRKRKKKISR